MDSAFHSNTEYYYTPPELVQEKSLIISGEEVKHIALVMRHEVGDELHVTDGKGYDYTVKIENIEKRLVHCSIHSKNYFPAKFENLFVCIPRLKSADRFELALEKSVELGITNLIVFDAARSVAKGNKSERWNKITLAAMKQSLHTQFPEVKYLKNLKGLNGEDGIKIVFEQNSTQTLRDILKSAANPIITKDKPVYLVFGPEGGLSENEMDDLENKVVVNMNTNRLRSETAIISAVSIVTHHLQ